MLFRHKGEHIDFLIYVISVEIVIIVTPSNGYQNIMKVSISKPVCIFFFIIHIFKIKTM